MCKEKIIQKNEIDLLIQKIKDTKEFLKEKFSIKKQKEKNVQLNNFIFSSSSTNLPTFYFKTSNNLIIEIMIEKQQYATGIQPMLYLDIPISSFINSNEIIGNTSAHIKYGILNFNKELKDLILNLFICFGMCSKSHNYDVLEILNIIKTNAF